MSLSKVDINQINYIEIENSSGMDITSTDMSYEFWLYIDENENILDVYKSFTFEKVDIEKGIIFGLFPYAINGVNNFSFLGLTTFINGGKSVTVGLNVSNNLFNLGKWNHIVFIKKRQSEIVNIVVNNVLRNTITRRVNSGIGLNNYNTLTPFEIGKHKDLDKFNCAIADFRVYTREISLTEINHSYNFGNGNNAQNINSLVLDIKFDSKSGDFNRGIVGAYDARLKGYNVRYFDSITNSFINYDHTQLNGGSWLKQ
jgi:hypothetical protein